jgi:methylmalonyl-CoA/ethylmalonyl-CoA epimerase
MKIEHLGIAVHDLDQATELYTALLGTPPYKTEEVPSEGVTTVFFQTGESKVELLKATKEDSPIANFIRQRGEGIHHVAFRVDDIRAEMARLKALGFKLLHDEPKQGADQKLICFLHPKSTGGVLVELCQERN